MLEFNATFIVAMISFIIFMIIMNAILYKPIERIQKKRADIISADNEAAKSAQEKTENLKEEHKKVIEDSKYNARKRYNDKINAYKIERNTIIDNAKASTKKNLETKLSELEDDSNQARKILDLKINEFASAIASKVLGFETRVEELVKK